MHQTQEELEAAQKALSDLQNFDAKKLARTETLGQELDFRAAVEPAERVIDLFKLILKDCLIDLPPVQLKEITTNANSTLHIFTEIENFTTTLTNSTQVHDDLLKKVSGVYASVFPVVSKWIAYSTSRAVDFPRLDTEARAAKRSIDEKAKEMETVFKEKTEMLDGLEQEIRKQLAKQGVTKQAKFFEDEAEIHDDAADKWGTSTLRWAGVLSVTAIASLATYKLPLIAATNLPEAIQLTTGKLVLLGALAFMLIRSARNYQAHKHSQAINRHKQNSLLTYTALVEAGPTPETRSIVLNHAAASIYALPDTGYGRAGSESSNQSNSLVELVPRLTAPITES